MTAPTPAGRVRRQGDVAGVSARSGWRVSTGTFPRDRFRAVPRTDTPATSQTHPPPAGATGTPTLEQLALAHLRNPQADTQETAA
ncbi:hypothetical protein AB0L99_12340 [Streptomyces sp. NPDC051954]|uniref:hypothetical protein n=1 Tax=Streptomyces sp. NPDC051954 TaxID=3155524 RepID=UPI0034486E90